jgi:AraC family transcriptional regulator
VPERALRFEESASGRPVDALPEARVEATSDGLGWNGVAVEAASNDDWDVTGLAAAGHYVAVHLGDDADGLEFGPGLAPRPAAIRPGQVWVSGAGVPFSWRVRGTVRYAGLTLDPALVARLSGADRLAIGTSAFADDPVLAGLVRTLAAEAGAGGPNGPAFVQTLALAVSQHLARAYGGAPSGPAPEGALDKVRLRRVLDLVEHRLDRDGAAGLSLDDLAREAALSASHFSKAFRAALGVPPYRYVLRRRVERARELLAAGRHTAGEAGAALGFSDPSHFTRAFRRVTGTTPSAFLRESRR